MDRPRFQVDIGTLMLAIAGIAVAFAVARRFGVMQANVVMMGVLQLVIYCHVRGRCRAEGRTYSDADRAKFISLWRRVGLPICLVCLCLLLLLFPMHPRSK